MSGYVASGGKTVELKGMQTWRLIALLIFTQIPAVLAYTIALPILAEMAKELAHDATSGYLVKMISGILGPAMAVGSLLAGILADRYERRLLLLGMGAVFLVAGVVPTFTSDLTLIVASRALLGFTGAALAAVGYTMAGDYLPEDRRAKVIGMLSACGLVGSLSSMFVSGNVAGALGWRPAFLLYLVAAPVLLLALPSKLPKPEKVASAGPAGIARPWYSGLPWGLLLIALGAGTILAVPGIYVSFHLASVGFGKPTTVAYVMMLNSFTGVIGSALFGKLLEKTSQRVVFAGAFGLMALGLAIFAFAHGLAPVLLAMVLMGGTLGVIAPGMPALAVDRAEEGERGKMVGMVQGIGAAAPLIGVSALEPLLPVIHTGGVMLVVGMLSFLLAAIFAFAWKK